MLELKNVSKYFPGVKALNDVSLVFQPGEIHALLGENGAGKSTLIKIISGIHQPESGEMFLEKTRLICHSYHDALEKGISIVNQEIQVIPESTVAENILFHGMKKYRRLGVLDWNKINSAVKKYLDMVGLDINPTTKVAGLSAAKKQLIQIAKALASDAKLLLLDEPTSSLTEHEAKNLFRLLRQLRDKNVIIVFVSHKLEEVFELCDKVSVLRDGKYVGTKDSSSLTKKDLIKMMIGRETKDIYMGNLDVDYTDVVLEVQNIQKEGKIYDANFKLYKGEILGFYGLVGSGRTELAKIIIGEDKLDAGEILVGRKNVKINSTAESLHQNNIGYVTENRKEEGLILDASVQTNVTITIWRKFIRKISRLLRKDKEKEAAKSMVNKLDIKITGLNQITNNLSGGNQQKTSIAKWLAAGCDILFVDEPTVGVDIGAKEYIHELIWDLAKKDGKSIILISSDMPELIKLARRILVFREKRIVGEISDLNSREFTYEEVSQEIGHYLA